MMDTKPAPETASGSQLPDGEARSVASPRKFYAIELPKPRWSNPSLLTDEFAAFERQRLDK